MKITIIKILLICLGMVLLAQGPFSLASSHSSGQQKPLMKDYQVTIPAAWKPAPPDQDTPDIEIARFVTDYGMEFYLYCLPGKYSGFLIGRGTAGSLIKSFLEDRITVLQMGKLEEYGSALNTTFFRRYDGTVTRDGQNHPVVAYLVYKAPLNFDCEAAAYAIAPAKSAKSLERDMLVFAKSWE